MQHRKAEKSVGYKPYILAFSPLSFYINGNIKLGNHPLHHCGAFYLQEPSASSAVTALDIKQDDKVLDLCAAPGGKSTQIAALLNGSGLIWSNEIVKNVQQFYSQTLSVWE